MDKEQLQKSFTYHPPTEEQAEKYVKIRQQAKELALIISDCLSDGREKSLAITKLEECVMWANKGVACGT